MDTVHAWGYGYFIAIMLDERSNRLLPQVQACADNLGCALPRPVPSGSFAMPARQRRRSQRPCTKLCGICAHVERCILVAIHCGLARLLQALLMSHW